MVTIAASLATGLGALLIARIVVKTARHQRPSSFVRAGTVPGLDVTPLRFWVTVLATAVTCYVMIYALTGLPVVSAVPAVVVGTLPRAYLAKRRGDRLARVQEAWPDGIRDVLASVRSGASLPNAIEDLSILGPEPLRDAFQGFAVYARSLGVVKALEMVKEDLADPTSDRVIEVLILAYERGGRVVPEILEDLAEATIRDLWTMEQVRTEALEQKINSRVVFAMPWLVLVTITSRSGAFRDFYSTTAGLTVVVIGGAMSLVGIWMASRLSSQPSEPRVFAGRRT
jgi:tight adherence protein B